MTLAMCKKLRGCKDLLKEWDRANFGDLCLRIVGIKEQLLDVQKQLGNGNNPDFRALEKELIRKLEDLWQKNAMFWHQRSRVKWLQMGDKNSRFFHLTTIQRRQRNQIVRLKDNDGVWHSENKEIAGIIKNHFQSLYDTPPARDFGDLLSLIEPIITPEMNACLVKEVSLDEVGAAVFAMGPLKAPGSDGFPGLFYQTYWDVVGDVVFEAVQNFFQNGVLLREVNHSNVTLIPKVANPETISQFRPISLCRFVHKIISRILTTRLQTLMGSIISEQQSAFITGRQVHDNIIVAHEVFHFLKHKRVGSKASVAIKLDLNKAYDRVCWEPGTSCFKSWLNWVSIKSGLIGLSNVGVRLNIPSMSMGARFALENKSLAGVRMRKRCPVVSHSLFADDSLVFLDAVPQFCTNFKELMNCFSEASGLSLNVHKSSLSFSANTPDNLKNEIKGILGMKEMEGSTTYLGLPALWGRSKKESMGYLRDRIIRKVQGWSNNHLNQAGKEDFESFNLALLAKQFWRLLTNPNALWARVLKGLYFNNKSCMEAVRGASPSWSWCSLLEGRNLIQEGVQWSVGNGESIQFWDDNWIPDLNGTKVASLPNVQREPLKVVEFINHVTKTWDSEKLKCVVPAAEVEAICKIPISLTGLPDKLIWKHTNSGNYTVKSGYGQWFLNNARNNQAAPSTSHVPPKTMWNRLWNIPTNPKVRMFMWKVVCNWIACRENLFKRKCATSPICSICDHESESIEHLLFHCPWSRAVWFGSGKSYWVLRNERVTADKWMEDLLCGDLAKETTKEDIGCIFQLCWAIWKSRNNWATFAKVRNSPTVAAPVGRRNPPPPGVLKINCDGAYQSSRSYAAFGIIARDSGGLARFLRCDRVKSSSALAIEAWALRIACAIALAMDVSVVIFESDCKNLIDSINDPKAQVGWQISTTVENIKRWAGAKQWSFVWTNRKNNSAAH
ncbi:uncharacterized protein LOC131316197 [Rhododendron vialii]|uniref:uncharacterized protein LOC131316197 n=1 Tax=Rhododendron vialii TaxID=182163 RepID=UPI0026604B91|nr:uncharacterized protein LOC131316197 [Rhododendron vialii]